jgi:hypothetical protein
MKELVLGGLLISPFIRYAMMAGLVFVPIRMILVHLDFHRWFWHPLLAEASIYTCILATLNIQL